MESLNEEPVKQQFVAIVGGATGACGRYIVGDLVNNPACLRVIALTRSDIPDPASTFPSIDREMMTSKLVVHKLDWKQTKETGDFFPPLAEKPSVAFCAMGSAPYTEESDFTMPVAFANASKKNGVDSMFLVSSTGAKAGSWFGYIDTIGRREEAFEAIGFGRLGIFRPGMMERHEKKRFPKEYLKYIMPSCYVIDTKDIAKSMIESALRMKDGTYPFSHSEMKEIAKRASSS